MSSSLKNYITQLQFIAKIKNRKVRDGILRQWSDDDQFFKVLKEIVENAMKKNLPLKANQKKSLRKYKSTLIQFINPKIPKRKRKQLVSQSGGFLPMLIPAVASFLATALIK